MSKNGYSYGPDEFDQPAPDGAPVGVHRAVPNAWSKVWPFVVVAVIFAGLAAGGFVVWRNDLLNFSADAKPTASQASGTQASSPAATESAEPEPSDGGSEDPSPPAPSPTVTGTIDKDATVRVLNGAGIQGLAAQGSEALVNAGYTQVTADDYQGEKLSQNTIYYKSEDLKATAYDIAAQLGIPQDDAHVQLVPANKANISVILMAELSS